MASNLGKNRLQPAVNERARSSTGLSISDTQQVDAPPAAALPPAPTITNVIAGLNTSDRSATAAANVYWTPAAGTPPDSYAVEWSTVADFSSNTAGQNKQAPLSLGVSPSLNVTPLVCLKNYYFRVAARYGGGQSEWSTIFGPVLMPADTIPPSQPSIASTVIDAGGNLVISGTNPPEDNFARLEFTVRGAVAGPTYVVEPLTGQPGAAFRYVWSADDNIAKSGGDATLTVEVRSQSWSGFFSEIVTVSATKNAPAAPTVSWDFSGPDALFNLTLSADTVRLTAAIDGGLTREIGLVSRWPYTFEQNRVDHGGGDTAAKLLDMANLTYSFIAYDALKQPSSAATGTAINAAPLAPTAIDAMPITQAVGLFITATKPADFAAFVVRIIKDGSELSVFRTTKANDLYTVDTRGVYQFAARVEDVFGQQSAELVTTPQQLNFVTPEELRADAIYTDSLGSADSALNTLKDDNYSTGGVAYT